MNKQYVTHQNRDNKRIKVDHKYMKENPEDFNLIEEDVTSKTVPGQSISIKELMDRYEKGRPIPQE